MPCKPTSAGAPGAPKTLCFFPTRAKVPSSSHLKRSSGLLHMLASRSRTPFPTKKQILVTLQVSA